MTELLQEGYSDAVQNLFNYGRRIVRAGPNEISGIADALNEVGSGINAEIGSRRSAQVNLPMPARQP